MLRRTSQLVNRDAGSRILQTHAAFTVATMAWTAWGNSGQAAKTTPKSGSSTSELAALLAAPGGRGMTLYVACWRDSPSSSCVATSLLVASSDVACRDESLLDARIEKVEAGGNCTRVPDSASCFAA